MALLSAVKAGSPLLPAQPFTRRLIPVEVNRVCEQKNTGYSTIDSALFGIRWGHKMARVESPRHHPTVTAAEGAKRRLSRPIQQRWPLALETVVSIAQTYNTVSASLADIRFLFVLLVGYAGLFRVSELLNVRVEDVSIDERSVLACLFSFPNERTISFGMSVFWLIFFFKSISFRQPSCCLQRIEEKKTTT